jgi:hypothetical protein
MELFDPARFQLSMMEESIRARLRMKREYNTFYSFNKLIILIS